MKRRKFIKSTIGCASTLAISTNSFGFISPKKEKMPFFVGTMVSPREIYKKGIADEETAYRMYLSIMGLDHEKQPSLKEQNNGGTEMHKEYIYKEAKRAVNTVKGKTKVYGRIGFDHPGYNTDIQPKQVYEGTMEMFRTKVDDVFCGREWDELEDKNIVASGNPARDTIK